MRYALLVSIALLLALTLFACQALGGGGSKPTVVINSPPSGSTFPSGADVQVQSTATDSAGVTRIELQVDGVSVHTDSSPVATGQSQFSVVQTWKATGPGYHNIIVRAYSNSGAFTDSGLTVTVTQNAAAAQTVTIPIATVVLPPTSGPGPTFVPPPATLPANTPASAPTATTASAPAACTPNSQFIADDTIPDGTNVAPGSTFTKAWRVLNSGTCAWDGSYSITFVGGAALATGAVPIPATPPGATVDISLAMTAPTTPGTYNGTWRLRAPTGVVFGTNLTTIIVVPNPASPPPPAATSTNTPLPSAPHIAFFTCTPCTITAGSSATLNYGPVTHASSATIDPGIGGISTPGHKTVSPTTTTTYTLTASGSGGTSKATVTITVVANFAGHWDHDFGYMDLTQSGASVTGTFHNSAETGDGTIAGTVAGNTLTGTWQRSVSGTLQFTMGSGGNTFTGNWNGSYQWCGAKTGISFPSGCAFDGSWNSKYDPGTGTQCAITLSQVGSSVTGTYCNGTISGGAITYAGGYVKLTGTWHFSNVNSGPFIFYLPTYTSQQFQGNYNSTLDWCGWRDGSSMPSPCEKN